MKNNDENTDRTDANKTEAKTGKIIERPETRL